MATYSQFETKLENLRIWLLAITLLGAAAHPASAAALDNSLRVLRVLANSTNATEVVLSLQYHYTGLAGPIARIVPVITQTSQNGSANWFRSPGVTVSQGQGPVSVKVKFRGGESDVPAGAKTDQVVVRMLSSNGQIVLATAALPQTIYWGAGLSPSEPSTETTPPNVAVSGSATFQETENISPEAAEAKRHRPWGKFFHISSSSKSRTTNGPPDRATGASPRPIPVASVQSGEGPHRMPAAASPSRLTSPMGRERSSAPAVLTAQRPTPKSEARRAGPPPAAPPEADSARDLPNSDAPASEFGQARQPAVPSTSKKGAGSAVEETEEFDRAAGLFARLEFQRQNSGSFSVTPPPRLPDWQQRLTLGPGDVMNISLFGDPETTKTNVFIMPDGRINFLEAQSVVATGLTVDELRIKLEEELSRFRRAPRAMISPVAYPSKKYYLLGKVAKPGVFTLDQPLTIIQAVARAHGLETGLTGGNVVELADLSRSFLVRQKKQFPVNFEKLFLEGDLTQNVALEPDDYLFFAPSELNEVYVLGEVNSPGPVPYSPDTTLVGALSAGRGFSNRAWQKRVLVIRGSLNRPETFVVNLAAILSAKEPDFKLRPKDILYVSERPWIRAEELLDAAATSFVQAAVVMWTGVHVTPISR